MSVDCTKCSGSGFLNLDQIPEADVEIIETLYFLDTLRNYKQWIVDHKGHDVQVCDCCGDGTDWQGTAGEHHNDDLSECYSIH